MNDEMSVEIERLCEMIMGTHFNILTIEEWKEIEALAFHLGHWVINKEKSK